MDLVPERSRRAKPPENQKSVPVRNGFFLSDNIYMSEKFTSLPGSEMIEDSLSSQKSAVRAGPREGRRVRRVLGIDPGLANTGFGVVDFCDGRYRKLWLHYDKS